MTKETIKKGIPMFLCFLLGFCAFLFYSSGRGWLNTQRTNARLGGTVSTVNQLYNQATISGEVTLRNFLINEEGQLIMENGQFKQGPPIILVPKPND